MIKEKSILRFDGSVWCNLDIALRHTDQIFREKVNCLGLTVIEWYILRALYANDGQNASQLANEVGRAATSFTPNLDKLQTKGYVTRLPDPDDRRAVHIFLTNKAKQEQDKILKLAEELDREYMAYFTHEELNNFYQVLSVLQTLEID